MSWWEQRLLDLLTTIPEGGIEPDLYGAYTTLLTQVFPWENDFVISPEWPTYCVQDIGDEVVVFWVRFRSHPVFFVEVRRPMNLNNSSKRKEADEKVRFKIGDLIDKAFVPTLYGVSAFGTALSIYEYDPKKHHRKIQPPRPRDDECPKNLDMNTWDFCPKEWWCNDLTKGGGRTKFDKACAAVRRMCEARRDA